MSEQLSHKVDKKLRYKSDDPIYQLHEYNIDSKTNQLYLFGEDSHILGSIEAGNEPGVEYVLANRFIKNMTIAMRNPSAQPILIHMKTCGGDWNEGMAVYDMIRACPLPVTILNYTHARSMSSIIFQAADRRVMMPHSVFMIHRGEYGYTGEVKKVNSTIDFYNKTEDVMLDIYISRMREKGCLSSKTPKYIKDFLKEQMDSRTDVFYTAEEAVKYGFADEIFGAEGKYDWSALTKF